MIPGPHDFYDGLNHELLRQMKQSHQPTGPDDPTHAGDDHASDSHHDLSHDAGSDHSPLDFGLSACAPPQRSSWLPSILEDLGHAAFRVVAESLFSDILLGGSADNHQRHDPHIGADLHVGDPSGDGFTHQTTGFTCAVVSQKMVMDQFHLVDPRTGAGVSEAQLVYDATVNGWLSDHGTSLGNLGKLLDYYGVHTHEGHDWKHLVQDLAHGHQVVMAVNADHLWHDQGSFSELKQLFGHGPNHAIVLKGLKVDDHGKVMVVVNDPGQAAGAGAEYPVEQFQSALGRSGMYYVATDDAPPGWAPELAISQLAGDHSDHAVPAHAEPASLSFGDALSQMTPQQKDDFLRRI